jgi:hypothetical protein
MASVREVIERLATLDPEQDIILEWWDKSFAEEVVLSKPLGDEEWSFIVDTYESGLGVSEEFAKTLADILEYEVDLENLERKS